VGKLERPVVRWAIASLFLVVEVLLLVVIPDPGESSRYEITPLNQAIMMVILLVLFAIIPSILKDFASKDRPLAHAADQVEATQQRRAQFVAGAVDRGAKLIRIETAGPVASWIAAGLLLLLAGGTVTESVSGMPVRLICATTAYLLLAAFATPPVRGYFTRKLRVTVPRPVVVIILIGGVLLNEAALAPPTATPATVLLGLCLPV
jgi:hypothetical protein